jgi:hypothetical protein
MESFNLNLEVKNRPSSNKPWAELLYNESRDINNFIHLINDLSNLSKLNLYRQPILFRGQANSDWGLEPKLWRELKQNRAKKQLSLDVALRLEYDSIIHFKHSSKLFLPQQLIPDDDSLADWLALMQHYSAPTRMLDWTTSFNIALYFAVNDMPLDKTGAVWFFEVFPMLQWMQNQYGDPLTKEDGAKIIQSDEIFVKFGLERAKNRIYAFDAGVKTERLIAQNGVFTFCERLDCDQAAIIGTYVLNNNVKIFPLTKILIPPEAKDKIRIHLNKLNITAATLFPGMDGLGKSISEIIRVESYCATEN